MLLAETTAQMKIRILWHSKRGCFVTYAPVICNHVPPRAGDSGGIAGLKNRDFTLEVTQ